MPYIDFPNAPADGDEFQAPNKFVYRWTDENRWKNVPRPLVIPDYIWPDMEPPGDDDPYDDGDPPGDDDPWEDPDDPVDGGGGEDWILEVIDMPVNDGNNSYEVELLVNQSGDLIQLGPTLSYGYAVEKTTNYLDGGNGLSVPVHDQTECQVPYIAQTGADFSGARCLAASGPETVDYYTVKNGEAWASYPQPSIISYSSCFLACNINLQSFLPAESYENKTNIRVRFRASFSYCGKYSGFYSWANLYQTNSVGVWYSGAPVVGVDQSAQLPMSSVSTLTSGWMTIDEDCENLDWRARLGGTREIGSVVVEIDDPEHPPERTTLPTGFACNPEMTKSWVVFEGDSVNTMRSIKHGDPGRLTNSAYDQTEYGVNYLHPVAGSTYDPNWQSIWFREDENWFAYVDGGDTDEVYGRHLNATGDITSHSEINEPQYNFRDYSSNTGPLGYVVANIAMSPDGDILYTLDDVGDIRSYSLSTPWDLSTASLVDTVDMSGWGATCFDITQDGFVIVIAKAGWVRQLILDTAWDLSTVYDSGFQRYFALEEPIDICVSADTGSIMVLDIPADETIGYRIYNYTRNI